MTLLLLTVLALIALYSIYVASRTARTQSVPTAFLDAAGALPGWVTIFLLPGLVIAVLGLERHIELTSRFGLQASHIAIGLVPVAITALLVWNKIWFATRVAGLSTPAEAIGRYFDSVALRIVVIVLAILFALPFAANLLSDAAQLVERATDGAIGRAVAVWVIATVMAVAAIIGGWRAIIMTVAMQSLLILVFFPSVAILGEILIDESGFPATPIAVADGVLWDRLAGVVQPVSGVGKETPAAGLFSAVGVASSVLVLIGAVVNPAALYFAQTLRPGSGVAISTVWLTAGFAAGCLLLAVPLVAVRMVDGSIEFAQQLYAMEPLAGVIVLAMVFNSIILAFSFFVSSGAILVTRDVLIRYLLPQLSARGQRLTARVALGFGFFLVAFLGSFLPLFTAIAASVVMPLAVQLLPALFGLTFLSFISRGAVLAGLTLGCLIVIFTEPLGIIVFEALFVDLPWGRWPLTIHSAAWGLVFNVLLVLLASTASLKSAARYERDRLHRAVRASAGDSPRGTVELGVLFLIWSFLAYGPGAVLGNTFFSDPIFTTLTPILGIPSLWVWQILFWLIGVLQVWLLAYKAGFGRLSTEQIKPIEFGVARPRKDSDWLTTGIRRLT